MSAASLVSGFAGLGAVARAAMVVTFAVITSSAHADGLAPDAVTPDGGRYFGPLVGGLLHGRGRIEWDSGRVYDGEFRAGEFSGHGRLTGAAGENYEGEFAGGLANGRGVLTRSDGTRYEGEFKANRMSGEGTLVYADGRRHVGRFVANQPHGAGRLESKSGDTYEGEFVEGKLTQGTYTSNKGGSRYVGAFLNWMPHGPGVRTEKFGSFEGTFENGQLVGRGVFRAAEGTRYEGEFKNSMPYGEGVMHRSNGDVYRGGFAAGRYHGEGVLELAKPDADGRKEIRGNWRYGEIVDAEANDRKLRNVEAALYAQRTVLDRTLAAIAPPDPDRINLYFLAVAGDGEQEVFHRETTFVQDRFDREFGTRGRSVALVNSRNTMDTKPMATLTSIEAALGAIASRMDRERDILFLYLTSHGSKDHRFVIDQTGMSLPNLSATELGRMLRASGIRWKVVVVSACYAGGFIDPIADEHTLVITAARHDRRSFGCADENEFTYFGRAFFKEALDAARSFEEAFERARQLVTEWELADAASSAKSAPDGAAESANSASERRSSGAVKVADGDTDDDDDDGDAKGAAPTPSVVHSEPQIRSTPAVRAYLARWRSQGLTSDQVTAQSPAAQAILPADPIAVEPH